MTPKQVQPLSVSTFHSASNQLSILQRKFFLKQLKLDRGRFYKYIYDEVPDLLLNNYQIYLKRFNNNIVNLYFIDIDIICLKIQTIRVSKTLLW